MKLFKAIILTVLLTSCSAQWHLNRAIKKDPSILKPKDTTIVFDTVVVTQSYLHVDTFDISKTDTVYYSDTVIKMRLIIKNKKVYAKIEKKTDSIWLHHTKTIRITKVEKQDNIKFQLLIGLILLYLLYKTIKFIRND